jgi:hypothetical protein
VEEACRRAGRSAAEGFDESPSQAASARSFVPVSSSCWIGGDHQLEAHDEILDFFFSTGSLCFLLTIGRKSLRTAGFPDDHGAWNHDDVLAIDLI